MSKSEKTKCADCEEEAEYILYERPQCYTCLNKALRQFREKGEDVPEVKELSI
jgi:hypothetical protein